MNSTKKDIWNGERLETNFYDQIAVEHLHRYALAMNYARGKNVLDLASGEGYGSNLIASVANSVIGVDISEEAIEYSRGKYQRPNLKFLQGSADKVPIESHSIDIVSSFETIEHHDKHEEMMTEIKRVLKPNGVLIISSPDKLNYSDIPGQKNPYHVKELYQEEFRRLIEKYFREYKMLSQKMVYASFIVPDKISEKFTEYSGDHESITSSHQIQSPIYNICVASDEVLDEVEISYFDGRKALDFLLDSTVSHIENKIKNSHSYRLGWVLIQPIRAIGNLLSLRS